MLITDNIYKPLRMQYDEYIDEKQGERQMSTDFTSNGLNKVSSLSKFECTTDTLYA